MNRDQFQVQMSRLIECYGKGPYGTERSTLIWRTVEGLSAEWLKGVVDNLIGSARQAPLVADFKEAAFLERERIWGQEKRQAPKDDWKPNPNCRTCADNGVYCCTNTTEPGIWAFRCHCERGYADPRRHIPQFKQAHIEQGFEYCDISKYREMAVGAFV